MDGNIFEYSKPLSLNKTIVEQVTSSDSDIILDFFAGYCTTAHAVLDLNKEGGGNRKFICVQLSEKCDEKSGFYLVNDNEIALILDKVDKKIIKSVMEAKPQKVITIDRLFNNNDQLKTNTALQMKDAGIEFKVV